MRRGEVWWADLPIPSGRRPVLLLSRDAAYRVRDLVTIAPLTTRIRNIPSEVRLGREDGLARESAVNLDVITTVPKRLLDRRITALRTWQIAAVEAAIHYSLGLAR